MVRRRTILGIGVSAIIGGLSTASATETAISSPEVATDPGSDKLRPIETRGKLRLKYIEGPKEEVHTAKRWFISSDLAERYGEERIEYEPITVPSTLLPEAVREGEKTTFEKELQRVIGTYTEHREAESALLRDRSSAASTSSFSVSDIPLYQYADMEDVGSGRMADRTSPINVAWGKVTPNQYYNSSSVRSGMKNGLGDVEAWSRSNRASLLGSAYEVDQYVDDGGTVRSTDEHVMEHIPDGLSCLPGTKQWHVRLTDVSNTDSDVRVVGQAHRDPCLHGADLPPRDWNSTDFYLENSRKATAHWWLAYDSDLGLELIDVGNAHPDHPTHDGQIALLDVTADRPHDGTKDPHEYLP